MAYPYPFKSTFAALLAGSALLSCLLAGPALANEVAKVKSMSFKAYSATSPIHVISTDGKKWNKLKSGAVGFSGKMNLNLRWPGFVESVAVVLGACGGDPCEVMPRVWDYGVGARDWSGTRQFSFDPALIPLGDADSIAPMPEGQNFIAECNKHLTQDGPTKSHTFNSSLNATFVTDTGIDHSIHLVTEYSSDGHFPNRIDHWRRDSFNVQVICDPVIKPPTSDISIDQGAFKPEKIKLFLATFSGGNNDGPNPAATCKGLRVTTRVETSKAGGVDIRLWRQEGQGAITSEFKSAWASYDAAKNGYFAEFIRSEKFDATTSLQFMAEVVGDTFAPSTQWKDITVRCTGAGGGGLSNGQPDHGDDPVLPPEKPKPQFDLDADDLAPEPLPDPDGPKASWAGEVTMADSAGSRKACPRKGQVFFAVTRNEPGSFKYKISCSNGQGFDGTALSYSQGGPTFEAYGAHDIKVSRTRTIQCTLQEVKQDGARVTIDKGSMAYTCSKPAIDPEVDDVTAPSNPTHSKPDVSILCKPGFKLVDKECVRKPVITVPCADDERRINGKCIRIIIDCYKGFHQVGMKCVRKPVIAIACEKHEQRIKGRCVPKVIIDCAKGFKLVGQKCVRKPEIVIACGANERRVKGRCVPKVIIDCLRGFSLKNGKCVKNPVIVKPCAPSQTLIRGNCVPKRPAILKKVFKLDPPQKKRAIIPGRALRAKGALR